MTIVSVGKANEDQLGFSALAKNKWAGVYEKNGGFQRKQNKTEPRSRDQACHYRYK